VYCCFFCFLSTPENVLLLFFSQHARYEQAAQQLQNIELPPGNQAVASLGEVQDRIQEAVQAHYQSILSDVADEDFANIGSVSRESFREILNKHVMRLNDDQVL
jgi:hypothetical protein